MLTRFVKKNAVRPLVQGGIGGQQMMPPSRIPRKKHTLSELHVPVSADIPAICDP